MIERLDILRQAQALAEHAGARQSAIARNIANADTPGYRAVDVMPFEELYGRTGEAMRASREGHIDAAGAPAGPMRLIERQADAALSPNGNAVSLETEMMNAAAARQSHDLALAVYQTSLGILRTSLGRGR